MNKKLAIKSAKEFGYVLLQFLFVSIKLFGFFSPVGLPFAFAKIYFGGNIFVVTIAYFVSKMIFVQSLIDVGVVFYEVVMIALYFFVKEYLKTNKKLLWLYFSLIISNALGLYFSLFEFESLWQAGVNIFGQICMLLYFYYLFKAYNKKFVFLKFSCIDYLLFSFATLLLSLAIFSLSQYSVYVGFFVMCLLLTFLAKIFPTDKFFTTILVFSIGSVVALGDYSFLTFAGISCVVFALIKEFNRYLFCTLGIAVFLVSLLIINYFNIFYIFLSFFAIFLLLIIPNKFLIKLCQIFEESHNNLIYKCLNERENLAVKNRLSLMAKTLTEMKEDFKCLLVGKIDRESACRELSKDIMHKVCDNCENYAVCFMQNINKKKMIEELLLRAIEGVNLTENELLIGVQSYCSKSTILANEIKQLSGQFLNFESAMKTEDSSKLMISSEIENFANIFENFSKNMENSLKINEKYSKILKETLISNLIDVKECAIVEGTGGIRSIDLIVPNELATRAELPQHIGRIVRSRVKAEEMKHLEISGLSLVSFAPECNLKAQFSVKSKAKEIENGDNSVITKLDSNRFFVAIADGMGHGKNANKTSEMILSLIKSLFKVGLDEKLIIDSVNRLLIPAGLENFSTLDACVVDLEKHLCTFIKLGASVSVLKHQNTSEVISCKSLPIGIVRTIKPTIVKKQISHGDIIFLASDGVVDSFQSVDAFKWFINDAKIYDLNKYLDDVVFDVQNLNVKHQDDITIIGIKILKN